MNMSIVRYFMSREQLATVISNTHGEEGDYFCHLLDTVVQRLHSVPTTYSTDGQGTQAIAHLHYFLGSCNWYITERDSSKVQHQAFGWGDLGYGGEFGYISIAELIRHGAELDLFFEPKPLQEVLRAESQAV